MVEVPAYILLAVVCLSVGYCAGNKSNKTEGDIIMSTPVDCEDDTSDECKLFGQTWECLPEKLQHTTDARCSHATLACYKALELVNNPLLGRWGRLGQIKVALRCENEDQLLSLQAQAESLHLCARSIQDAGRTQIAAGSRTVLGIIGPARIVDQVTGKLRLW